MPPVPAASRLFPPEQVVTVKALACERPAARNRPLSRLSVFDVCQTAWEQGISMSYSTVWRLLHRDALRPWFQRQWLFPRDPQLLEKATPVLELYQRCWQDAPLGPRDVVLCADEMTGLQALSRMHPGTPAAADRQRRYEFEYERHGTLCYLAFLNVFTGRVYGESSATTGIEPFERALGRCLRQPVYQEAERIFLIVDNGSSHHPRTSPARIAAQHPQVTVIHLPTHSSWLNQIEIYFSILHRKALSSADFPSLDALRQRIFRFQRHYNERAEPFTWKYTRQQLEQYVARLALHEPVFAAAQAAREARARNCRPSAYSLTH